jgi:hypothetical protein
MRRAITVVALSVLALAVIAPAAQARTKQRYFQDLALNGPFPGRVFITVIYKDSHGDGRFRPRSITAYSVEAQVSCNPGGTSAMSITKSDANPYTPFKQRLKKGRFATAFQADVDPRLIPPIGEFSGRVTPKRKVNGSFYVTDWDPNPGGRANCISSGSFHATKCGDPKFINTLKIPACQRVAY